MRKLYSSTTTHCRRCVVLTSMAILCGMMYTTVAAKPREQANSNVARGLVSSMKEFVDLVSDGEPEMLSHYEESTYDNHGNRTLFVEHTWQDDRWRVKTTTSTYDIASNLIHEVTDHGLQVVKKWLDYDSRRNVIEELVEIHNGSELSYVDVTTYRYDQRGNLVERTYERDGVRYDELQRWTFSYNERGDLVETVHERDNGLDGLDIWERSTFTYNERGDLMEELQERSYGSPRLERFSYDSNGRLQERRLQWFDADFQLEREDLTEYAYEPTGAQVLEHMVVRSFLSAEPLTWFERWTTRRYDPRGNLVEILAEEDYQDGRCGRLIWTHELDTQGRPLAEHFNVSILDCDGDVVQGAFGWNRTYTYDQWGNVVQETLQSERDGKPTTIDKRIYEY